MKRRELLRSAIGAVLAVPAALAAKALGTTDSKFTSVCRTFDGTSANLYIDGVLVSTEPVRADERGIVIDEFRISNFARYSAEYTPPNEPFDWDKNTVALFRFDEPQV